MPALVEHQKALDVGLDTAFHDGELSFALAFGDPTRMPTSGFRRRTNTHTVAGQRRIRTGLPLTREQLAEF